MSCINWIVVLGPDGTVLGASGGAPATWIGARLAEIDGVSPALRSAARDVVAEVHAGPRAAIVTPGRELDGRLDAPTVYIAAVEAIPVRRGPVDVREALTQALAPLRRQAGAGDVGLRVRVDEDVPARVYLDGEKLCWIATTLVGNALRHVRHGSTTRPGGSIGLHVGVEVGGSVVVLTVADDGPGIPADKLASLFAGGVEPPHGAGLGLRLIDDTVRAHGGTVDVKVGPEGFNRGTTVTVRLPV